MRKKILTTTIVTLLQVCAFSAQSIENSITIEDTPLKGGGTEYVIKGGPDVISKSPYGTIYSDESQLVILKNKEKLINYTGFVNFHMEKLGITIGSDEMTDKGNGVFTFQSAVTISQFNLKAGSTFSCKNGKVVQNGKSTGRSSVTYHNVLKISCSSTNVLSITPKKFWVIFQKMFIETFDSVIEKKAEI